MRKVLVLLFAGAILIFIAYEALIYYDNEFRFGRMRETPAVKPHEEPLLVMDVDAVPVSGGDSVLRVLEPADLRPPFAMDSEQTIARGKSVYFTFCAQCHGNNYNGRGTVGQSFQPLPTDLRSAEVQSESEGKLFKTISYGIPDGRQPALHFIITVEDRWRVVAFVKSLGVRK
ncbi:MAG: cytochrome c [Syntrophobacterales bacterium]|jgi:mono/diheme cytochrome c family protein